MDDTLPTFRCLNCAAAIVLNPEEDQQRCSNCGQWQSLPRKSMLELIGDLQKRVAVLEMLATDEQGKARQDKAQQEWAQRKIEQMKQEKAADELGLLHRMIFPPPSVGGVGVKPPTGEPEELPPLPSRDAPTGTYEQVSRCPKRREGDEYFCPACDLRWVALDSGPQENMRCLRFSVDGIT